MIRSCVADSAGQIVRFVDAAGTAGTSDSYSAEEELETVGSSGADSLSVEASQKRVPKGFCAAKFAAE